MYLFIYWIVAVFIVLGVIIERDRDPELFDLFIVLLAPVMLPVFLGMLLCKYYNS